MKVNTKSAVKVCANKCIYDHFPSYYIELLHSSTTQRITTPHYHKELLHKEILHRIFCKKIKTFQVNVN